MSRDFTLPARFMAKVAIADDGCWNWTGGCCLRGYGNYWDSGKTIGAHRFAAAAVFGDLGEAFVMHLCDNRKCVNPDHLALGSHLDNMADMIRKGRHVYGERHHATKMTSEKVIKARIMAAQGVPVAEVARRFGIAKCPMQQIISGRTWRHLPVIPTMPAGTFTRATA